MIERKTIVFFPEPGAWGPTKTASRSQRSWAREAADDWTEEQLVGAVIELLADEELAARCVRTAR